ncbi:MAG: glutamate--tRNA ligase [Deltaproteobacteria bacterium]|nr:glutamate--tRNA ligase [Deltaproteobacteria bacterium]
MKQVVTRFPPSPTGALHVGNARTAIFNWLYARHTKGKFILRIEDTDIARSTKEAVDVILDSLQWLGIDWDEGPYFQSKRMHIYHSYAKKLFESGNAYYCTCSPEKLEAMRKKALASGGKPKYDGTCRNKGLARTPNAVLRLKAPQTGTTVLDDVIKGKIVFQNAELDDFILLRSDGVPTYNYAVVIDDMTMGINTVIRGDDHVNNTPRQILLYRALNSSLPIFGHVPLVLGKDRTPLSKRHGATSVTAFREMGFLPDALLNYLVRLGWSYGDQEFFTRDELIEKFSIENIGRSSGVFDMDKLLALNADHIKAAAPGQLAKHLLPFLKQRGADARKGAFLESVIRTLKTRSKTLIEMADGALFYYQENIVYETAAADKVLKPDALKPLTLILKALERLEDFSEKNLEAVFKEVMDETGLKMGKIAQPVRVALTGKTVSPGIFEIVTVLGKERVVARIRKAIEYIEKQL